jgi:Protein of unknown function (DUF2865)
MRGSCDFDSNLRGSGALGYVREPDVAHGSGERTVLKSRHNGFGPLARAISFAALAGFAVAAAPAPAAAQSLFDFFSGARRPAPPPMATAYADPQTETFAKPSDPAPRAESGPAVSYCVRLCDGHFFPIQRSAATPIEICNSFCPASRTKVFSGSTIDHAVARDGSRYADLGSAYAYRTRVVPGCTCNGKDAFGLAPVKASEDPTLRQGDVVATEDGFVAYNGGRKRGGDFTPIGSAAGVPADSKRQLAQTRIAPAPAGSAEIINSAPSSASARDGNERQAQLAR